MALSNRRKRSDTRADYWPGFVDAMATLLLVMVFLLSVFMLAQTFLSQEITGRDEVLDRLNNQIAELTDLLALQKSDSADLTDKIASLELGLDTLETQNTLLKSRIEAEDGQVDVASGQVNTLATALDEEKRISRQAQSQITLLNRQLSSLRRQIAVLEDALDASENRDRESQTKIADLGKRLNVALAQRVQELSRYRSDFFGRLRDILSQRSDIQVVGDRFVFQSEVLFASGSEVLEAEGRSEMDKLASAILELEQEIPSEINWVLRIDGHTDNVPVSPGRRHRDNWDLSTGRAVTVVQYLMTQGVSPARLVAAGFGEFRPIQEGDSAEARLANRRIELKLTER